MAVGSSADEGTLRTWTENGEGGMKGWDISGGAFLLRTSRALRTSRGLRVPWERRMPWALVLGFGLAACGEPTPFTFGDPELPSCDLPVDFLTYSVPPDAIPSLLQPEMVTIGHPGAEYMRDEDRVLGIVIQGQPRAYPHKILWHHEIVSDRVGDVPVAATFCPLTGSGLVFDPVLAGEELDIGVSGLLFANNLVLYDRATGDVFGPQLAPAGRCSRFRDATLQQFPVLETSWGEWRLLNPNTTVVSSDTGFDRNYEVSPYGDYDDLNNDDLLFDMPVDDSRPLKERVLALRGPSTSLGFPFGELSDSLGDRGAVHEAIDGDEVVVFYSRADGETAVAYSPEVGGEPLTFEAGATGGWTDIETGSTWNLEGRATAGPHRGERLAQRPDAFVVFWFAWRHFDPDGSIWGR